jgi:intein-encoded DNA endonuclease-like protein
LGQKPIFYVRAHSKRLFSFIKNLTFPELKKILARESHAIAFLRGFYEAEGSFKRRGEMSISNSNRALLMFVGNLMGKVGVPVNVTGPYLWGTNRKPMFLIQVGKEKTKKFLGLVKPSIKCGVDG